MIETKVKGFALGFQQIKSSKTGKIYYKLGFFVDENSCSFLVNENKGRELVQCSQFQAVAKTHQPQPCELTIGVELTERGSFVNLVGVK